MSFEVGPLVEGSTTRGTLVRRVLHVQNAMNGESSTLAESLAAFGALERLFLRVDVPETMYKGRERQIVIQGVIAVRSGRELV